MDTQHKAWNERQKRLQAALADPSQHALALQLFLHQHALLHAGPVSGIDEATFEDQLWQGLDEDDARCIPTGSEHSIAWCVWHITRIEDLTMNLLVAGRPQLLLEGDWLLRLNVPFKDTGNSQPAADTAELSTRINLPSLRSYRHAVGTRTRHIVQLLSPAALRSRVPPEHAERIWQDGAVLPDGREVVDYWAGRTVSGLLLMPATRHPLIHLNEAMHIKQVLNRKERFKR
jgi:hypothetical protein